jgi:xylulokinase
MLLTIDIGTSNFKAALWNCEGKREDFVSFPLSIMVDEEKHEAQCVQILRAFEDACAKLGKLDAVRVVVISGNGPSLVPVLAEPSVKNESLCAAAENARLWLDKRAEKYIRQVSSIMGGYVDAAFFLPKILYIKNEEKSLYERTKYFLGIPEYLSFALTGQARNVFPSDGFDRWFWNNEILEKLSLDPEKMPPFIRPGEVYGELSSSAAKRFGFANNVPVISGGPDFYAAIIGSGVNSPAQACNRTGSSEGINVCTENKIENVRLMSYAHPVKPYWNLSGTVNTTGKAIEWCRSLLQIPSIEDFFALAKKSKHGSSGLVFRPYLAGERGELSQHGSWSGLSLSTGREEMALSVLEGICFAIKDIIGEMEKAGAEVGELRLTGGLAANDFLNQLKADITGKPILQGVYKETELLGLAITGSIFLGKYKNLKEAMQSMVKIEKEYHPNPEKVLFYSEIFKKFCYSKTSVLE